MSDPVWSGPGEPLYEAYRAAYNHKFRKSGVQKLPRWKALKPKHMEVWNAAAKSLQQVDA